MTKIKNTKKGMAKKTLSISLAVAMLATSNVPVWAAEFTDGTDAAFTSEVEAPVEVVDEAPVVDEEVAPEAKAPVVEGHGFDISATPFSGVVNGEIVWADENGKKKTIETDIKVTPNTDATEETKGATLKAVWKDSNGQVGEIATLKDGALKASIETTPEMSNKQYKLYVYAENNNTIVWDWTSDSFTVKPVDINEKRDVDGFKNFNTTYTGKAIVPTVDQLDLNNIVGGSKAAKYGLTVSDFEYTPGSTKGDTVNVTDEGVDVYVSSKKVGYTGSIIVNYKIAPLTLTKDNVNDWVKAEFVTTSKPYTGNAIPVFKSDVKLVDKKSGVELNNYIPGEATTTVDTIPVEYAKAGNTFNTTNEVDAKVSFAIATATTGKYKNYEIGSGVIVAPTNAFAISKRDLSTVDVVIPEQPYANGNIVQVQSTDATYYDKTTKEKLTLAGDVVITSTASTQGEHDVTVTPATNNTNVEGSTTAKLYIVASSLETAEFSNMKYAGQDEEYTGERILKDVKKLGNVTVINKETGKRVNLTPEDYTVEFGANINAGKGQIIIKGLRSYAGSRKVIEFTINPAEVTADTVSVSKFVELKDTTKPEDYKEAMNLVVKAKNKDGKEFTLVEGTDFVVEKYSFENENKIDNKVVVTLKTDVNNYLKNKNFKVSVKEFKSTITDRVLKAENIKLKKTSYTYAGVAIKPDFDVVVDGRVIAPDRYKVKSLTNNVNVGTATMVITGVKGEGFSADVDTSVNFTITAADAADLKATVPSQIYSGYSIEPGYADIEASLNDVVINVKDNFTLSYGENVNIGEGTVILTPKNGNFTGTKTITFKITGQMLKGGDFTFYNENGLKIVTLNHKFDGTEFKAAKTVLETAGTTLTKSNGTTVTGVTLKEGTDYEIKYVDNVYGKKVDGVQKGAVLAIAKGSYAGNYTGAGVKDGVYTDAAGNKVENVLYAETFDIEQVGVTRRNVSVSNGTYAGGLPVKPVVKVNVEGKDLVEGVDYKLEYPTATEVTTTQSLKVTVIPMNGYKINQGVQDLEFNWGVDKFDLANADVTVKDNGATVIVKCGRVDVATSDYVVTKDEAANTVTVTAKENSKNYKGSKTVSAVVITPEEKPETPVIEKVNVSGNKATVVLSGESEGAVGYDYVISTDKDCINNKDYDKVNKNILNTTTDFTYVGQDVYYAYCHAWKRGEDGKKIFSDWSNAYPFVVSAITPSQPAITSVKVKGSTVTVTYTKSSNADGYDVVLGSKVATVAGEKRPVEYGTLVKKNIKGNTVTATFKNVKKGTYYAGLHAFNRTSEDGKKVFSPWSNVKRVTVK